MSGISIHDFYQAIAHHDTKRLSSISGVGKKTAERLVLELKDQVRVLPAAKITMGKTKTREGQVFSDVAGALVALGYKPFIAENAARKVVDEKENAGLSAEDLVRKALKYV